MLVCIGVCAVNDCVFVVYCTCVCMCVCMHWTVAESWLSFQYYDVNDPCRFLMSILTLLR